jgi:hypothetical protein
MVDSVESFKAQANCQLLIAKCFTQKTARRMQAPGGPLAARATDQFLFGAWLVLVESISARVSPGLPGVGASF